MRFKPITILAALAAITSIAILVALIGILLPVAAITASNRKAINLIEPTIVGSITLQPGENTIEWNGPGLCHPRSHSLFRYQTHAVGKVFAMQVVR